MVDSSSASSQSPRARLQSWLRLFHPARERLRRDPFARITSLAEIAIAAELGIAIDVNQATVDDWLRLPGISIHQARTLVNLSRSGVIFYGPEDVAAVLGVPCAQLLPLQPLLLFYYYDPTSPVLPACLSINQATVAELMHLPGMSAPLLERVVNERRRSPFTDWHDIHQRLRLTPEQTSRWMHYLRL